MVAQGSQPCRTRCAALQVFLANAGDIADTGVDLLLERVHQSKISAGGGVSLPRGLCDMPVNSVSSGRQKYLAGSKDCEKRRIYHTEKGNQRKRCCPGAYVTSWNEMVVSFGASHEMHIARRYSGNQTSYRKIGDDSHKTAFKRPDSVPISVPLPTGYLSWSLVLGTIPKNFCSRVSGMFPEPG